MQYKDIIPLFLVLGLSTQALGMDTATDQSWEEKRFPLVQEELRLRVDDIEENREKLVTGLQVAVGLSGVAFGSENSSNSKRLKELTPGFALLGVGSAVGYGLLSSDSSQLNRWGHASAGFGLIALGLNGAIIDESSLRSEGVLSADEYRRRQATSYDMFAIGLGLTLAIGQLDGGLSLKEVNHRVNTDSDLSAVQRYDLGINYLRSDLQKRKIRKALRDTLILVLGIDQIYNANKYREVTDTSRGFRSGALYSLFGITGYIVNALDDDVFLLVDEDKVKAQWSLLPTNGGAAVALTGNF